MRRTVYLVMIILVSFQIVGICQGKADGKAVKRDSVAADSLEYRLVVFDTGFETWLLTKPPMSYYSNDYYMRMNRLYVLEWNGRYVSSNQNGLYDNYIDFDPKTDYGLEINYRLYYFFRYFEETNHLKLLDFDR